MTKVKLSFLGAVGTVTGSKYLLELSRKKGRPSRILVDAGLFQGERRWREANWEDPSQSLLNSIDCCVITHAHVDHCGILPRYRKLGLKCPIFATKPSCELVELLLIDSATIQEEDAEFRAGRGRSRHNPPMPLYTVEEAKEVLPYLRPVNFDRDDKICSGVYARWTRNGHILGAAAVTTSVDDIKITFAGDVGRYGVPILRDPQPIDFGNLLVVESTYGNRTHESGDPKQKFADVINRTIKRGGSLIIPSFAVGRTQILLYYLRELKQAQLIPDVRVVVDSPMAQEVTTIYDRYPGEYDEEALGLVGAGIKPFYFPGLDFTKSREASVRLNADRSPMIIISASGMLSGGRILHHLRHRISEPLNTVLFVGYQPPGGKGARIKSGAGSVQIFNEEVSVRAEIAELHALSAHADRNELLRWCKQSKTTPGRVAVVHGDEEASAQFSQDLQRELGWQTWLPKYMEQVELS